MMKPKTTKINNNLQSHTISFEEILDTEAAKIIGGNADSILSRMNILYELQASRSLAFMSETALAKSDKDRAGKVQN